MYQIALKQRQFYIDTFALRRFHMLDYYKVLACVAWFWFDTVEPVVCSACGGKAIVYRDTDNVWVVRCAKDDRCSGRCARTKRQAIKRWNKFNRGIVCDIRKD